MIVRIYRTIQKYCLIPTYSLIIKILAKRTGKNLRVTKYSIVSQRTTIKNNVTFNGIDIRGIGEVNIGNKCKFGEGVLLITQFHDYDNDNKLPYGNKLIKKDITIEDNVWIGSRAIILGGIKIGEGAIIQAGSVVVNDVKRLSIVGGHPAKEFKVRNEKHYMRLKNEL